MRSTAEAERLAKAAREKPWYDQALAAGATLEEAQIIHGSALARWVALHDRADVDHALDVRAFMATHKMRKWATLYDVERAMDMEWRKQQ
jgi:hypothetical protein